MKVGILTYFDGINYGAFAQVYALQCRLVELGFDVKVIAYKNSKHTFNEYKSLFLTKKIKILLNNIEKLRVFRVQQKRLNTTNRVRSTIKVSNMGFDKIIIGSDEVWNFNNDLFGVDLIYFGNDLTAKSSVMSYSASFGSVNITDDLPFNLGECLSKLDSISVRDDNSLNIVKKYAKNAKNAIKTLDPTFLYDFKGELSSNNKDKYILFYGITLRDNDQNFIKEMLKFSKLHKMKIISVGYYHDWADFNYVNICPFTWLDYINNASFVVTNMFHGTIFSIKFNKQFITIKSKRRENKVNSLLSDFNLEGRLKSGEGIVGKFQESMEDCINYDDINLKIKRLKKISENYIQESLVV